MSVFKVNVQNPVQGQLDIDPTTGLPFVTSKQRQVYIMGPNRINRELHDGDTFTDCNYYKQFCYPQAPYDRSFLSIVTDDGSVWSSIPEENKFGVAATWTLATTFNSTNVIDFLGTYGSVASFVQITNLDGSNSAILELNGNTNLTMTLPANQSQVFNTGDLAITYLRAHSVSGTPIIQIMAGVQAVVNS